MSARDDALTLLVHAIQNQPRTLQSRLGPSELGRCPRYLLHKLAGTPEPTAPPALKPVIGTAAHALFLDRWFPAADPAETRWVTERRVTIGAFADGTPITGSCDLYDRDTRTVIDLKFLGKSSLTNYKANGPGNTYRTQVHLYGLGFAREPDQPIPENVAIWMLPRDGEIRDAHWWEEPWQPQIALDALNRLGQLEAELRLVGLDEALKDHAPCTDPWCGWCRAATRPTTTAALFAQHLK